MGVARSRPRRHFLSERKSRCLGLQMMISQRGTRDRQPILWECPVCKKLFVLPWHGQKGQRHEFPDLSTIESRRSAAEISTLIRTGSGKMPSFQYLSDSDRMFSPLFY